MYEPYLGSDSKKTKKENETLPGKFLIKKLSFIVLDVIMVL